MEKPLVDFTEFKGRTSKKFEGRDGVHDSVVMINVISNSILPLSISIKNNLSKFLTE